MAISLNCGCVKLLLPNNCVVDVLTPVLDEISKWLQTDADSPESGGYVVGYEHKTTKNIVLENVSRPYPLDIRSRIRFDMRDPLHKIFLMKAKKHKSFYMGVWHTHPQDYPTPSSLDWDDWKRTMESDKTGCDYIFFIIAGIAYTRIWVGDPNNGLISELFECEKTGEVYVRD